jgi:hypothetical protein
MGDSDKDIYQKQSSIRFCLINDMVPFLEVDVPNYRELSDTETVITDIDVLGVRIEPTGHPRRMIFDCKTAKVSPINRAFWASGLMQYADCNEAFVLLKKRASEAHRLSAKTINVHLFDDKQFKNYAESCSVDFNLDYCYSTDIQNWLELFKVASGNAHLDQCLSVLNVNIPLERDCVKALRQLISVFQKSKGEFDPDRKKHVALFYFGVSAFAFLMAQIVHDLRNILDFDSDLPTFEKVLKYYIWGGRDSFKVRNRLKAAFAAQKSKDFEHEEAELNGWPKFVELTRNLLDSPGDIKECIGPLREFAIRSVVTAAPEKDAWLAGEIQGSRRIRQFSLALASYFVTSARLPKDFNTVLNDDFNSLRP